MRTWRCGREQRGTQAWGSFSRKCSHRDSIRSRHNAQSIGGSPAVPPTSHLWLPRISGGLANSLPLVPLLKPPHIKNSCLRIKRLGELLSEMSSRRPRQPYGRGLARTATTTSKKEMQHSEEGLHWWWSLGNLGLLRKVTINHSGRDGKSWRRWKIQASGEYASRGT